MNLVDENHCEAYYYAWGNSTNIVLMGAVMVAALLLDEVVLELPDLWLTALFWTTVEGVLAGFE